MITDQDLDRAIEYAKRIAGSGAADDGTILSRALLRVVAERDDLRATLARVREAAQEHAERDDYGSEQALVKAALALLDDAPAAPREHGATCQCRPEAGDCAGKG